jgi:hypothetical protein
VGDRRREQSDLISLLTKIRKEYTDREQDDLIGLKKWGGGIHIETAR